MPSPFVIQEFTWSDAYKELFELIDAAEGKEPESKAAGAKSISNQSKS